MCSARPVYYYPTYKCKIPQVPLQEVATEGAGHLNASEGDRQVWSGDVQAAAAFRRLLPHHLWVFHPGLQHTGAAVSAPRLYLG